MKMLLLLKLMGLIHKYVFFNEQSTHSID